MFYRRQGYEFSAVKGCGDGEKMGGKAKKIARSNSGLVLFMGKPAYMNITLYPAPFTFYSRLTNSAFIEKRRLLWTMSPRRL